MSDPNMDEAAVQAEGPDVETGTPDSEQSMGTTVVGGPVDTGSDEADASDGDVPDQAIDPDTGLPVGGTNVP